MLTAYKGYTPKPTKKDAQKIALQTICDNLSQQSIDKAILAFRKRLRYVWRLMEDTSNMFSEAFP